MKRTKIVVTLGPATDTLGVLDALVSAGLDAARLNYSHGSRDEQARRAKEIREMARKKGKEIALIADLQGPKIRLECFEKVYCYKRVLSNGKLSNHFHSKDNRACTSAGIRLH